MSLLFTNQRNRMAFHAPEIVEEPAGKTHEKPQTPVFLSPKSDTLSSLALPRARKIPKKNQPSQQHHILLGGSGDLGLSTLGTLLADLSCGLALGGRGVLGLLGLLGGGGGLLLLLALLDGGGAGGGAGLGALGALLLDHVEGGTDDGTLGLDGAAGSLLGDFLLVGRVISPCSWLLLLPEAAGSPPQRRRKACFLKPLADSLTPPLPFLLLSNMV